MIAAPHVDAPIPEAVASLSGRHLPARVQQAIGRQAGALRRYAELPQSRYMEARWLLAQDVAAANKILAAYSPRLIADWNDLPVHIPARPTIPEDEEN